MSTPPRAHDHQRRVVGANVTPPPLQPPPAHTGHRASPSGSFPEFTYRHGPVAAVNQPQVLGTGGEFYPAREVAVFDHASVSRSGNTIQVSADRFRTQRVPTPDHAYGRVGTPDRTATPRVVQRVATPEAPGRQVATPPPDTNFLRVRSPHRGSTPERALGQNAMSTTYGNLSHQMDLPELRRLMQQPAPHGVPSPLSRPPLVSTPQSIDDNVAEWEAQAVITLTEMAKVSSPAVSIVRDDLPHQEYLVEQSPARGDVDSVRKTLINGHSDTRNCLRLLNKHQSRSYPEMFVRHSQALPHPTHRHPSAADEVKVAARKAVSSAVFVLRDHLHSRMDSMLQDVLMSPGPLKDALNNVQENVRLTPDFIREVKRILLKEMVNQYTAKDGYVSDDPSADENEVESGIVNKRIIKKKKPFDAQSDTDSEASSKRKRPRSPWPSLPKVKKSKTSNLVPRPIKIPRPIEVPREGPLWDPERLKPECLFVMGAKANKALGLGATRGRIYTKHPELFKFTADVDSRQWLQEHHRVHTSGGKAYMFLVEDILRLAKQDDYRDNQGLLLKELVGFTIPDWILDKAKKQMETQRTKPTNMHLAAVQDFTDTDSDRNLPFTTADGSNKSLSGNKHSPSPEEVELMSSDGTDAGTAQPSPFTPTAAIATETGENGADENVLSPPTPSSHYSNQYPVN